MPVWGAGRRHLLRKQQKKKKTKEQLHHVRQHLLLSSVRQVARSVSSACCIGSTWYVRYCTWCAWYCRSRPYLVSTLPGTVPGTWHTVPGTWFTSAPCFLFLSTVYPGTGNWYLVYTVPDTMGPTQICTRIIYFRTKLLLKKKENSLIKRSSNRNKEQVL